MELAINNQIACRRFAHEHGVDEETITGWRWPFWRANLRLGISGGNSYREQRAVH